MTQRGDLVLDGEIILIRDGRSSDVEDIHAILRCPVVMRNTLQLPIDNLDAMRNGSKEHYARFRHIVAERAGRVIGDLGIERASQPRRMHSAAIGMAVHDDYQRRGVGSLLVASAIDLCEQWMGIRRIELEVFTGNTSGVKLYEKFGFVTEGTLRDFALLDGRFVDAYSMARVSEGPTRASS